MKRVTNEKLEAPVDIVVKHIENNRIKIRKGVALQEQTIREIEAIRQELGDYNEQRSISQIIDQAVHSYFVLFKKVKEDQDGK